MYSATSFENRSTATRIPVRVTATAANSGQQASSCMALLRCLPSLELNGVIMISHWCTCSTESRLLHQMGLCTRVRAEPTEALELHFNESACLARAALLLPILGTKHMSQSFLIS